MTNINQPRLRQRCSRHGITVEQFIAMFYAQDFRCAICKSRVEVEGIGRSAIDHCHSTGRVRGILCGRCNMVLGKVESIGLQSISNYLSGHFNIVPTEIEHAASGQPKSKKHRNNMKGEKSQAHKDAMREAAQKRWAAVRAAKEAALGGAV